MRRSNRGAIQLVDAIFTFFVLVSLLALAPFFNEFTGAVQAEADPFSSLLLGLFMPFLILALIYSVGVSAKRGG